MENFDWGKLLDILPSVVGLVIGLVIRHVFSGFANFKYEIRNSISKTNDRITECFTECGENKDKVYELSESISDEFSKCRGDCETKRVNVKADIRRDCALRHKED